MATGVPAIVTGWSGPLEYATTETGWLINHKMEEAKNFTDIIYKENCGSWASPDKDHLKQLMRYAYEHQDEVRAKGRKAAEYVRRNWLWPNKIKMFHEALGKHL
jgi:glycosyltransferase involved in cell wall biosynthesis